MPPLQIIAQAAFGEARTRSLFIRLCRTSRVAVILEILAGDSAHETNAPSKIKTVPPLDRPAEGTIHCSRRGADPR
jgi:hypothetical protein